MTSTEQITYNIYQNSDKNVAHVVAERGLKETTIIGHLSSAVKCGLDVDLVALGLTDDVVDRVSRILKEENLSLGRLSPIKEAIDAKSDNEISWGLLKLSIAVLVHRYGVNDGNTINWPKSDDKTESPTATASSAGPSPLSTKRRASPENAGTRQIKRNSLFKL